MDIEICRNVAEERCSRYTDKLALIYLIVWIITAAVSGINFGIKNDIISSIVDIGTLFVTGPISMSICFITIKVFEGKDIAINDIFSGFQDFIRAFLITLLRGIFIGLQLILLIVPGIIAAFAYSMTLYIAIDNPEMDAYSCIKASKKLMYGHKKELFVLYFSYILWILLCVITLGILSLWVNPKIDVAKYTFYCQLTNKYSEAKAE